MLPRSTQTYDLIGVNLRVAWSNLVTEPLPERLRRLLERLASEEIQRESNGATKS